MNHTQIFSERLLGFDGGVLERPETPTPVSAFTAVDGLSQASCSLTPATR